MDKSIIVSALYALIILFIICLFLIIVETYPIVFIGLVVLVAITGFVHAARCDTL